MATVEDMIFGKILNILDNSVFSGIFLTMIFVAAVAFVVPLAKNFIKYLPPSWRVKPWTIHFLIIAVVVELIGTIGRDIYNLPIAFYPGVSLLLVAIGLWPWIRSGGLARISLATERQHFSDWAKNHNWTLETDLTKAKWTSDTGPVSSEYRKWAMYLPTIEGEVLAAATVEIDGGTAVLGYMYASTSSLTTSSRYIPAIYLQTNLPRSVSGKLRVRPTGSPFRGFLPDRSLESVQFNRGFDVETNPRSLAYSVLHPDTMQWLMDLELKPIIYLDHQQCAIILDGHPSPERLNALLQITKEFWRRLDRSGALEKKARSQ